MSPQSALADRFADIVIITGLTKELEWFSRPSESNSPAQPARAPLICAASTGSGTARFPSWPSANSTKG